MRARASAASVRVRKPLLRLCRVPSRQRIANAVVGKKAGELLRKKRESTGEKRLELTLALDRGWLYLTYSVPAGRRRVQD
jgi:hypothetical protein